MTRLFKVPALIGLISGIMAAGQAQAHEFWIQPQAYRIELGVPIVADVKVGQDFNGNVQSYFPDSFRSFDISDPQGRREIGGRIGDRPAITVMPENEGLQILSQWTTTSRLDYGEFAKFESFVRSHGMDWVLEAHMERGLPELGFNEGYTRFVKTLVAVGNGEGQDRRVGLILELIAQANPYTDDISAGLPMLLIFDGVALPDIQIDLFYRDQTGVLSRTDVVTDAFGMATIPNLGAGEYMINAVHMIIPFEADTARTGIVWHSLWASMTYEIGA